MSIDKKMDGEDLHQSLADPEKCPITEEDIIEILRSYERNALVQALSLMHLHSIDMRGDAIMGAIGDYLARMTQQGIFGYEQAKIVGKKLELPLAILKSLQLRIIAMALNSGRIETAIDAKREFFKHNSKIPAEVVDVAHDVVLRVLCEGNLDDAAKIASEFCISHDDFRYYQNEAMLWAFRKGTTDVALKIRRKFYKGFPLVDPELKELAYEVGYEALLYGNLDVVLELVEEFKLDDMSKFMAAAMVGIVVSVRKNLREELDKLKVFGMELDEASKEYAETEFGRIFGILLELNLPK